MDVWVLYTMEQDGSDARPLKYAHKMLFLNEANVKASIRANHPRTAVTTQRPDCFIVRSPQSRRLYVYQKVSIPVPALGTTT